MFHFPAASVSLGWTLLPVDSPNKARREIEVQRKEVTFGGEEINWDGNMLALIWTRGTCFHYFCHVLLIVFTLYNILSGNISRGRISTGKRAFILFCQRDNSFEIFELVHSNMEIVFFCFVFYPDVS